MNLLHVRLGHLLCGAQDALAGDSMTIAGLPALIIPFCIHLLARSVGVTNPEEAGESGNKLTEILNSFSLPFVLMLTAYVVGRAGLWKPDSTKAARGRVSRVFVYLDGAYGFYAQLAIAAAFTCFFLNPELQPLRTFLFWISIWQLIVYMRTTPAQLFHIIGYSNAERVLAPNNPITLFPGPDSASVDPNLSNPDPPIWKYRLCILFVIPAIAIGVFIAVLILKRDSQSGDQIFDGLTLPSPHTETGYDGKLP